ncbi:MAG: hypothetical protein KF855_03735 [Acidobacteria bacterium]|nr:hypothetical protein [Acidobacteriota bacterium]
MGKEYSSAPEIEQIAERLIEHFKPDLEGFDITYIFCSENPKKAGREVTALARKVIGLNAWLAGFPDGFFVMEVGLPAWAELTPEQKIAVVHHELCHFGVDDEGFLTLIPHDIEEFNEIARTHGAYHDGLVSFGHALQHGNESSRSEILEKILNG